MSYFNRLAENAIEYEKQYMLADYDLSGDVEYYWPSIEKAINDTLWRDGWGQPDDNQSIIDREWTIYEKEALQSLIVGCAADLLSIGYGYHVCPGYFAIANCEEIEIDLQHMRWTKHRRETVSRYSDVYISDQGLGYVNADFHLDIDLERLIDCFISEFFE